MSQKQKEARLNYLFHKGIQENYPGMVSEIEQDYKDILKENEISKGVDK